MAVKKEPYELQKVTLNLRLGDWEWLRTMHGEGAGKAIREMVIGHVNRSKAAAEQRYSSIQLSLPLDAIIEGVKDA